MTQEKKFENMAAKSRDTRFTKEATRELLLLVRPLFIHNKIKKKNRNEGGETIERRNRVSPPAQ